MNIRTKFWLPFYSLKEDKLIPLTFQFGSATVSFRQEQGHLRKPGFSWGGVVRSSGPLPPRLAAKRQQKEEVRGIFVTFPSSFPEFDMKND